MTNIACRIFKEQIDLLLSLPDQNEAKEVLYQALTQTCNHFDNQTDNQFDNQNANQNHLYLNHISVLSNNVYKLLLKNINWKEFSDNYGGTRKGAGKPKKELPSAEKSKTPSLDDVKSYAQTRNRLDLAEKFYDYFNSTGWVDSQGKKVKNWKAKFITWESHSEKPREKLPRTWWRE